MTRVAVLMIGLSRLALASSGDVRSPIAPTAPRVLAATQGLEAPDGYHAARRPQLALVAPGAGAIWAGYAVGAFYAVLASVTPSVLCAIGAKCVAPMFWGVLGTGLQTAGLLALVAGLVFPIHVWVLDGPNRSRLSVEATANGLVAHF